MLCEPLLFLTDCFSSSANVKEVGNGNVLQWIVMVCIKRVIVLNLCLSYWREEMLLLYNAKSYLESRRLTRGYGTEEKCVVCTVGCYKRGTGNGERGTGNGERGTGNGEQRTGYRDQGIGNRWRGNLRTGSGERGKGNGERAQGKKTWKMGTKQRIRNEVAETARVQVRFCSHF